MAVNQYILNRKYDGLLPKISCIYKIVNKVNNKVYIGCCVNFANRFCLHRRDLLNKKHHSNYLQKSFNKHGIDNFYFEILEEVVDIKNLEDIEKKYIYLYDSINKEKGYNICITGRSRLGVKTNPETREKMRLKAIGRKMTDEDKYKMRIAKLGKPSNNGLNRKVSKYTLNGDFIASYLTIANAARENNIGASNISNCINGKGKTAGKFKWK